MRDPGRINKVVETLRAFWLRHPDLRLGQIVECATPVGPRGRNTFNMEEDEFLEGLKRLETPPCPPRA